MGPDELLEIDRNARAYGWEAAISGVLKEKYEDLSGDNPFLDLNWREKAEK